MPNNWIVPSFLRTKVARRVLLAFSVSALVPITLLAAVSYSLVTNQLYQQAHDRLQDASRSIGQSIYERLIYLDAQLANVANATRTNAPEGVPARGLLTALMQGRVEGLAVRLPSGQRVALVGDPDSLPALTPAERRHLAQGNALLLTFGPGNGRVAVLVREVAGDGGRVLVWAQLNPGYLWGGSGRSAVAGTREVCLLDDEGFVLDCSIPVEADVAAVVRAGVTGRHSGDVEFAVNGVAQIGGFWSATMHAYRPADGEPGGGGAHSWRVIVSEPEGSVLSPVARFRQSFPLIALLSLWVALLMGNVQIRRSMEPLTELARGTERVARRDFSQRVHVSSNDEFRDLAVSFNGMAARIDTQFRFLTTINEIDRTALSSTDQDAITRTALTDGAAFMGSDAMVVGVTQGAADDSPWLLVASGRRATGRVVQEMRPRPEDLVRLRAHPGVLVTHDRSDLAPALRVPPLEDPVLQTYLVFPLILRDRVAGAVALGYARAEMDEETIGHGRQLADQLAVALSNARLVDQLERLRRGALTALARTIDAKSPWTAGHSERVTAVSLAIGREMGLPNDHLDVIYRGGLLHDVGKIGVPAAVLDKPGPLTDPEFAVMRSHVTVGARILAPIEAHADIIPIVLYHHERLDGSGYPEGLSGSRIPYNARLLAVADVFDAVSSPRPYRAGWAFERAVEHIRRFAGVHFDREFVEPFFALAARGDLANVRGLTALDAPPLADGGRPETAAATEAPVHGR